MNKKILYIEDEQNLLDLVLEVLTNAGYDAIGATDGLSGIKIAKAEMPDLILLDLNLPNISGWEVISMLKGDSLLKDVPIVVITGDTDAEGLEKTVCAGSSGFLSKPLNLTNLPSIIEDFIHGKTLEVDISIEKKEGYLREQSQRLVSRLYEQIDNLTETNQKITDLNKEMAKRDAYIENMLDPLWVLDLNGNTIDFNPALKRFLGCSKERLMKSNVNDFLDEKNREIYRKQDKKRIENLVPSSYQLTFTDYRGIKKQTIITGHPIIEEGILTGTFSLIKDVSNRKLMEEKYRQIIESTSEGMYQCNLDGILTMVNPALIRILGYDSKEELLNHDIKESIYNNPESWNEYISNLLETKTESRYEKPFRKKNGDEIYIIGSSKVVIDEYGTEPYISGSIKDITERWILEREREKFTQALKEKNSQLKEVNILKDEFLANMSHELRTPLNSIIGFSEVMVDGLTGDLNEEQSEFVENIRSSGLHLLDLINNILDLSKIRAGMMTIFPTDVSLCFLSKEICGTFLPQATKKNIEWNVNLPDYEIEVKVDPMKIKQVLINIIGNAFKFTPDNGVITLTLKEVNITDWENPEATEAKMDEGNAVSYHIQDSGIGLSGGEIEVMFDEFRQIDGTYTRDNGGTGLGLPISEKFITLHGGKILVQSEQNVGTNIIILFPKEAIVPVEEKSAPGEDIIEYSEDIGVMVTQ